MPAAGGAEGGGDIRRRIAGQGMDAQRRKGREKEGGGEVKTIAPEVERVMRERME